MSTPRRRILRPESAPVIAAVDRRRIERLRTRLAAERSALERWLTRLRRACTTVAKTQQRITRAERQLRQLETP
jgi:hypothetical protein